MTMRGAPVDRISDLPSDILDNILKYVPVRDAVRTSILSKKWRYQWVTMPHLIFDENFRKLLSKKNLLPEAITSHILSLHNGAVTKFLVMDYHHYCSLHLWPCPQWLLILSDRHLEDLALSSYDNKMPLRLFDFKQLKHLYLNGFEISEIPPTFEGFTSLVKLDLLRFCDTDGRLGKFLSKCPMLEYLNLEFDVVGGMMEEPLKDLDRLIVLKLGNVRFENERYASCVLGLIKSSPNLRCLDISMGYHSFYESDESNPDEREVFALEYLKAQYKVHVHFSRLEDVKINGMLGSCVEMEFIKILLLRAVALRTLKIESVFKMGTSPGLKMIKKLDKAPRASKFLNIIFAGTWTNL